MFRLLLFHTHMSECCLRRLRQLHPLIQKMSQFHRQPLFRHFHLFQNLKRSCLLSDLMQVLFLHMLKVYFQKLQGLHFLLKVQNISCFRPCQQQTIQQHIYCRFPECLCQGRSLRFCSFQRFLCLLFLKDCLIICLI